MPTKVKVIRLGFHGSILRYPGDVFDLPPGERPASWMEKLEAEEPEPPEPAEKQRQAK